MLHSFTRNHRDISTDAGFQFEFYCDSCGNGFKSTFIESTTYNQRMASESLGRGVSTIGNLLGGRLGNISNALERGVDIVADRLDDQSPQWRREQEAAFNQAQAQVKPYFQKCPACQQWVCRDCWNEEQGLCIKCAPRESTYVAKARAEAMKRNIDEAAATATVWTGKIESRTTICPACGQPAGEGKFCNNCGQPLGLSKCPNCGASVALGIKFCSECGAPMAAAPPAQSFCPSCGQENEPGAKFCGGCGAKLG
ncbi:MAG: zinc ribbon domain-containing protein [Bacillota bacterium]|nr:zinc ribbon domain-containing protein [Bacillota bacterium]